MFGVAHQVEDAPLAVLESKGSFLRRGVTLHVQALNSAETEVNLLKSPFALWVILCVPLVVPELGCVAGVLQIVLEGVLVLHLGFHDFRTRMGTVIKRMFHTYL